MRAEPILIIDDDRLIRRILEHAFSEKGWAVSSAPSAETGLKLIRSAPPKVLILDIFLPGKWSGLELLRLLKTDRNLKEIMVVMMTAGDAGRYVEPCRQAGAEFIMPKPFSPKAFVHQVEMLLRQKEGKS